MKIYINNLNLELTCDLLELFKDKLKKTHQYIELYTNEGLYYIDDRLIYFLDITDKDIQIFENYYNKFTLITDYSFYEKNTISSIHGETHILFKIMENHYKLDNYSTIYLVIKYNLDNQKIILNDIYFESQKDIDINDVFIKNEIIEFLSLLN